MRETSERARDAKVCETRLAVLSDQDVALGVPRVNAEFVNYFVLPTGVMPPCRIPSPWRCIRPLHACASYYWQD
jgi:hypothetical protein